MAHINRQRQIQLLNRYSLNELMPTNQLPSNFAVFCGSTRQRSTIGLYAIQQCVGRIGVVFIHDDPALAERLNTIQRSGTSTALHYPNRIITPGNLHYDPLYGLNESTILDIIVPQNPDGFTTPVVDGIRARLADYLSIMRYRYNMSPDAFGNYPYNLDMLVQLTQMSYTQLKDTVFIYLPEHMRTQLEARLSADNVQQSVRDAVQKFQKHMEHYLWTPRNGLSHTRISIYESVVHRHIISIYVPNSAPEILDYIDHELQALTETQTPYFLMGSGINLLKNERIKTRFLGEHTQLNYRTGILSGSPTNVLSSGISDFGNLTSQYQNVIVLECSGTAEAELFSQASGTYYRRVISVHQDRNRQPLHILPSNSRGRAVTEQEERRIRPNELTSLDRGALIFSKNRHQPMLINHFNLTTQNT